MTMFPIVETSGGAFERGRTHGEQARARQLAAARAKHGIVDLKRLLRDESEGPVSICRKPDRSLPDEAQTHTVASVIMELARGVMHVAPDEPSRADYQPIRLAEVTPAIVPA